MAGGVTLNWSGWRVGCSGLAYCAIMSKAGGGARAGPGRAGQGGVEMEAG